MLSLMLAGSLAGLVHVISGPDHLTAVAPLALRRGRNGWLAGWTWGLGHTAGVVSVATLAVVLRASLPPIETLSNWGERIVGVALIAIGAWALRRGASIGNVAHQHGGHRHEHLHVTRGPGWFTSLGHAHASFYMGVLHGIAGSSHFLGVLPALALPSNTAALAYVAAFGMGSIVAMTAFASLVGLLGTQGRGGIIPHRALMYTSGVSALLVGGFWLLA